MRNQQRATALCQFEIQIDRFVIVGYCVNPVHGLPEVVVGARFRIGTFRPRLPDSFGAGIVRNRMTELESVLGVNSKICNIVVLFPAAG
jgi:hypothetical protein